MTGLHWWLFLQVRPFWFLVLFLCRSVLVSGCNYGNRLVPSSPVPVVHVLMCHVNQTLGRSALDFSALLFQTYFKFRYFEVWTTLERSLYVLPKLIVLRNCGSWFFLFRWPAKTSHQWNEGPPLSDYIEFTDWTWTDPWFVLIHYSAHLFLLLVRLRLRVLVCTCHFDSHQSEKCWNKNHRRDSIQSIASFVVLESCQSCQKWLIYWKCMCTLNTKQAQLVHSIYFWEVLVHFC